MTVKTAEMEKLFDEGKSFIDLLPYLEFKDGVFIQLDGSLGRIWELSLLESEIPEPAHLLRLSKTIEGLFTQLPHAQLAFQFILLSDDFIVPKMDQYSQHTEIETERDFSKIYMEKKTEHIRLSKDGFFNKGNARHTEEKNFYPQRIRLFFTLRYFPKWQCPSIINKMKNCLLSEDSIRKGMEEKYLRNIHEAKKIIRKIEGVLRTCGFDSQIINELGLIQFLYPMLNPERSKSCPEIKHIENEDIRDQVLYNSPGVTNEGFIFEGHHSRIVSLKELPEGTFPGMFSGDMYLKDNDWFCMLDEFKNFMMVINLIIPSQTQALDNLKLQKKMAHLHGTGIVGDAAVENIEKEAEINETITDIFKTGKRVVYPRIHFVVIEKTEDDANEKAGQLLSCLQNRLLCEGIKEDIIGPSLFLTCLPLNFDPAYERFIKRSKRMLSDNLADMVPAYGAFQGTKTPAQMYLNRRGEPVFFDFFDSNTNPHGFVIGESGAGKSFLLNDLILQNYRLGAHFFVIDQGTENKGGSYKKLCKLLKGQYISFSLDDPVTINPFHNPPTAKNISFLSGLLAQMASGDEDHDRVTRQEKGLLLKAIRETYNTNDGRKEPILSDLVDILSSKKFNDQYCFGSNSGNNLALKMANYVKKEGGYGNYFDGPNQFNINTRLTVFDLENLSSEPELQKLITINILSFIIDFVTRADIAAKRKYLILDEAWDFPGSLLKRAVKTFRKLKCSVIPCSQDLDDFLTKETGQAILANCSNNIILRSQNSTHESIGEKLKFSSGLIQILKSLQKVDGRYSEAFFVNDKSKGVIRLVPDPYLFWVANTENETNEYLEQKTKEMNGDFVGALEECVKEYPYGIS